MNEPLRRRRLPLKVLYRGLEISAESEALLEEAMERIDTDNPDEVLEAALGLVLENQPAKENMP